MQAKYIIVQAGGKGTRLKDLTKNKPKGIVPVNNKPIIFNLFDRFPDKNFIVIGDYLFDVLRRYMDAFANVKNITVNADGTGTCGGIKQSLELIPDGEPFMLVWSDLILGEDLDFDFNVTENLVGISKDFECRWSYKNGIFEEIPSKEHGVAGLFMFKDKSCLIDIPQSGELVHWFSKSDIVFSEIGLWGTREVGTLEAYNETENKEFRCRPFNSLTFNSDKVIKNYLGEQGKQLSKREVNWYKAAKDVGYSKIPEIYSYDPLTMNKINGYNIFKKSSGYTQLEKKKLVDNLINTLSTLHDLKTVPTDKFSILEAYYTKTISRLSTVRDLIPLADNKYITVNGRKCRNVFFYQDELYKMVTGLLFDTRFAFIHGDCTFSNIMTDDEFNITLLDPRGYFGFTELCGDVLYDWSKLYYSIYGNYDRFNNKDFSLNIDENGVALSISSNNFEDMADYFLKNIPNGTEEKIKLLHAIIWLSLTTYAWEDYDSVCGAFYNGIYHLEELL